MRIAGPFIVVLAAIARATEASDARARTLTLSAWSLTAPTAVPLGEVIYTPGVRNGRYEALASKDKTIEKDDLVRVGFNDEKTSQWVGSLTTSDMIRGNLALAVQIDLNGDVWHFDYTADGNNTTESTVVVLKASPGETPYLNKPVVLDPEGKLTEKEVEKTFLQKYWWLVLAAMIFLLGGGGGGGGSE